MPKSSRLEFLLYCWGDEHHWPSYVGGHLILSGWPTDFFVEGISSIGASIFELQKSGNWWLLEIHMTLICLDVWPDWNCCCCSQQPRSAYSSALDGVGIKNWKLLTGNSDYSSQSKDFRQTHLCCHSAVPNLSNKVLDFCPADYPIQAPFYPTAQMCSLEETPG